MTIAVTVNSKQQIFESLSNTVHIYTRLTLIIVISSMFVYAAIAIFGIWLQMPAFSWIYLSIDCAINLICLLLYFEKARLFYGRCLCTCPVHTV